MYTHTPHTMCVHYNEPLCLKLKITIFIIVLLTKIVFNFPKTTTAGRTPHQLQTCGKSHGDTCYSLSIMCRHLWSVINIRVMCNFPCTQKDFVTSLPTKLQDSHTDITPILPTHYHEHTVSLNSKTSQPKRIMQITWEIQCACK